MGCIKIDITASELHILETLWNNAHNSAASAMKANS